MFEGSLVESRGLEATGTERWTALGSLTLQCALVAVLLTIPMVRPEVLRPISLLPRLTVPVPVKPPALPVHVQATAAASSAMSVPSAAAPQAQATHRFVFPRPGATTDGTAPALITNLPFGSGDMRGPAAVSVASSGPGPIVTVAKPKDTTPTRVSGGVSQGLLLAPIHPVYPPIAQAAGVQGSVVMEAVISKSGRIESLHTVSGPEMLRKAAMDAVAVARYRPYLLSGEPTEVQTTITVVFKLGS
jgi:periplasmic protein TonB